MNKNTTVAKVISWLIQNTLFVVLVAYSITSENAKATTLIACLCWLNLIQHFVMILNPQEKCNSAFRDFPWKASVNFLFDFCVFCLIVLSGCVASSFAYIIGSAIQKEMIEDAEEAALKLGSNQTETDNEIVS